MAKQALPPFVIKVLTTEYLIEGTVPGDTYLAFPKPDGVGAPIPLTSVQIQLTRSTEVTARTCMHYFLPLNNAVAVIPHMDFTLSPQYMVWKQCKNPITGLFRLGPYWMMGRLMTLSSGHLQGELPIYDVRLGSQIPGTQWGELNAPFALVNGFWLHGWETG